MSRPGLQLAGFFDHFEPMRLQVLGNVETSYLQKLSSEQRAIIFDHLFSYKIPALVIARNLEPLPECLEMAKKHDITVLRSHETTSYIVSSLISALKSSGASDHPSWRAGGDLRRGHSDLWRQRHWQE